MSIITCFEELITRIELQFFDLRPVGEHGSVPNPIQRSSCITKTTNGMYRIQTVFAASDPIYQRDCFLDGVLGIGFEVRARVPLGEVMILVSDIIPPADIRKLMSAGIATQETPRLVCQNIRGKLTNGITGDDIPIDFAVNFIYNKNRLYVAKVYADIESKYGPMLFKWVQRWAHATTTFGHQRPNACTTIK